MGWLMWIGAFALLMALAATVPTLYLPLLKLIGADERSELWVRDGYYATIAISGLVLLFCLYTVLRHRELLRMRRLLDREINELEDARARLSEVSTLFSVSTSLNLQLRLEVILEIIVRRVVSTLRAQQASVMIYNPETSVLETRASYGLESEFARNAKLRLGEGIAGWVAERREGVLLGPQEPNQTFRQHYKPNRNITSALSLPMRVGDRCVGVLNVNRINHPEPFQEHHREMLRLFAEHVASVVERAEVVERMQQRNMALEESNLQLSQLNRMKDVFLSTASHELKTPLTSVIAYAELLEDGQGRLPAAQQSEFLRRMRTESHALLGLIDDILDLSRLETGKLSLDRGLHSVNALVGAAIETAAPLAEKHDVTLEQALDDELPELEVDEVKVRQVALNLIVNAIKFSPRGSAVAVRSRRDERFVVIEVSDHGPGVHPEDAVHIFELFGQGMRSGAAKSSGLGIGLHLVKRLTELHGGHVGLNSAPGQGSTFWVRLPIAEAEPARAA